MLRRNVSLPPSKQRQTGVSLPPSRMRASSVVSQGDQRISQRDTKSKAFVSRAITNLIEFLEFTEYPNAISTRLLQSPSSKEIFCIFEHVIRQVVPLYRIGRPGTKLEDTCLDALTRLGYPYVLSRQYLATPGAPHAWPSVLAALDWLREQVVDAQELLESGHLFKYDDEQDPSMEPVGKVLHEFALAEFDLQKPPNELQQEFGARISALLGCPTQEDFKALESTISQLDEELKSYDGADNRLEQIQSEVKCLEEDLRSLEDKRRNLEDYHQKLLIKHEEHRNSVAELSELNAQLRKQLDSAKQQLKEQEDAGLGRLIQDYLILQERYQSRLQDKAEVQKEIEQKELAFSRREGRIAPALDTYNRLITALKAPEYEEVAKNCDLKIRTYRSGFDITTELPAAIEDVGACLSCVQSLTAKTEERLANLSQQISDAKVSADNLDLPLLRTQKSELEDQIAELNQLLATADSERNKMEQDFTQQRQIWATERSELDTLLTEARSRTDELETTLDRISQRRFSKAAFIEEVEFKATAFLPTFRHFVELRELSRNVEDHRRSSIQRLIEHSRQRIEEMKKNISDSE